MADLQHNEGTAIALITHDMGVVARMCDRIEVMKDGAYVESGPVEDIFYNPQHDYTRKLLDAMPRLSSELKPSETNTQEKILTADDLKVHFTLRGSGGIFAKKHTLRAVDRPLQLADAAAKGSGHWIRTLFD